MFEPKASKVETLKAGRELDALIHERTMGLPTMGKEGWSHILGQQSLYVEDPDGKRYPAELFKPAKYSTDISAAWEILENFSAFVIHKRDDGDMYWTSIFVPESALGWVNGPTAATAPLAICLGVLATVEELHHA